MAAGGKGTQQRSVGNHLGCVGIGNGINVKQKLSEDNCQPEVVTFPPQKYWQYCHLRQTEDLAFTDNHWLHLRRRRLPL